MVGVFLGRPASADAGLSAIRDARDKLLAFGSLTNVIVVKDDASSIRIKATWQEARFTLSLTANTGYIHVQGSSGLLLAFGSHVASVIGGSTHVAKDVGAPPTNTGIAPEPGRTTTPVTPPTNAAEFTDSPPELSAAGPEPEPALGGGEIGSVVTGAAAQGDTLVGEGNVIINNTIVTTSEAGDASAMNALTNMLRSVLRLTSRRNDGEDRRA